MAARRKNPMAIQMRILLIMGLVCALVFKSTSAILLFAMIPTIVAFIIDPSPQKTKALTVGAMNFAGAMPYLLKLWTYEGINSMQNAIEIIANPKAIALVYLMAAAGYAIEVAVGGIVSTVLLKQGQARLKALEKRLDDMEERWGEEVTGDYDLDEYGFRAR